MPDQGRAGDGGRDPYWTVQVNDLIGGWIVTDFPHPLSEHNHRSQGDVLKRSVIACECSSLGFANLIAKALNGADDGRTDA